MSEITTDLPRDRQEPAMNDKRNERRLEWGFRLLIIAFVALWVIYPPHKAAPTATVSTAIGTSS